MIHLEAPTDPVSVDLAHVALLVGLVLASKPARVVELGVGPGYTARALLQALRWNGKGELICVDDWRDTGGAEPPVAAELRQQGVKLLNQTEEEFCRWASGGFCDVLVCDADHNATDQRLADLLRILRPAGWLFCHDTANPEFPNLTRLVGGVRGLPHWHFREASRPDELCNRGWLVAQNRKPKVAVVSAWDDRMTELAGLTIPNHQDYCLRWGYDCLTRDRWERTDLGPIWAKWALAAEVLPAYDWVFCLDVDAIFMNMTRPLPEPTADLTGTVDVNGLNMGAVILKNTEWACSFLNKALAAGPRFSNHGSPEQTTMAYLLYAEPKDRWAAVPQRQFNSFLYGEYRGLTFSEGEFQDGDFILHLPALSNARRLEVFRVYLPKVRR